jgi:hypothetical protein
VSTFNNGPRGVRGGIVVIDPDSSAVLRVISLQYNPDSITRTLQVHGVGDDKAARLDPLRLKAPPTETYKVEAELDATDQLEIADQQAIQVGLHPQLAALETLVSPTSNQLLAANSLQQNGTLEIAPMEAPLTLFIWSQQRILPVRITDLSITEEAFDGLLNPIRAKVNLSLRVLTVDDVGFQHKAGTLFLIYQQGKERLAAKSPNGPLSALGIGGIP